MDVLVIFLLYITVLEIFSCTSFRHLNCTLILSFGACRVNFKLKSDTNLFEIVKCKTSVSAIEVPQLC